jgi:NAD(P)-dependent dehydrogenase (short-subunit alcohol dehydrogenase family)
MNEKNYLAKQVVVITGCSTGIGRALAFEFHRRGHRTFATARRQESVEELKQQGLEALQLDVTQSDSIRKAISKVIECAGRIDILVNNAGFNPFGPLAEVPIERVRSLFEVNVIAVLEVIQEVFKYMAQQRFGRIVNIGSVAGLMPSPFSGPYCAAKSALHMLSDVLRLEIAPFGIDVVVVQPGGVQSNVAATGSAGLERYQSETSLYRPVYSQIVKRANASQKKPMPAKEFAEKLVGEVTKKEAPRVVLLGSGVDYIVERARLAGPELDRIMSEIYKLDSLRNKP